MKPIYEPKGRAGEYCGLAINIYNGCNHGCTYVCSKCGATSEYGSEDYCPFCGARMDADMGNHISGKDDNDA